VLASSDQGGNGEDESYKAETGTDADGSEQEKQLEDGEGNLGVTKSERRILE
jgi:hypothetical protein